MRTSFITEDSGASSNNPTPGSPINFDTQNVNRFAPGVVIQNNVVAGSGNTGIHFAGETNVGANVPAAAVPVGAAHGATARVMTASPASAWVALVAAVMVRAVALATATTAAVVPASVWAAAAKPLEKEPVPFLLPAAKPCHSSRLRFMRVKLTNHAIPGLLI